MNDHILNITGHRGDFYTSTRFFTHQLTVVSLVQRQQTVLLTWTDTSCCVWPELPPRNLRASASPAKTPWRQTPEKLLRARGHLRLLVCRQPPSSAVNEYEHKPAESCAAFVFPLPVRCQATESSREPARWLTLEPKSRIMLQS